MKVTARLSSSAEGLGTLGVGLLFVAGLVLARAATLDAAALSPQDSIAAISTALGLEIASVPVGSPAAIVTKTAAENIGAASADLKNPIGAQHGVVDAGPGIGRRAAWILLYQGGDPSDVSWGPIGAGAPTIVYSGLVIDDQTGDLLLLIHKGHH
jgi:hypothetical protein